VTFERPNSHRASAFIAVPAAIAIAVTIGCQSSPMRREPGLNVLLITIDTLRADALGAYGNTTVSTPWLDRLSGGGVRFSRAMAQTVVTLPSHANILSGRYPFRHGVRENSGFRFPVDVETMATLLKARGYRTGAIDPALTKAHNGLGVVVAQRGVFEKAATHWKQAVTLRSARSSSAVQPRRRVDPPRSPCRGPDLLGVVSARGARIRREGPRTCPEVAQPLSSCPKNCIKMSQK